MIGQLLGVVEWFPQDYAAEFYAFKGGLALCATLMLIWHMTITWHDVTTTGRQLRYYALLAFAVLVTGSSVEQVREGAIVSYRNIGSIICVCLLIWAMAASILEDVRSHARASR